MNADLQRLRVTSEHPGSGGTLSRAPEDFTVREVLAYAPTGQGEHLFVEIEKVGLTTPEAARRVAEAGGLGRGSWAGMKDRAARASQWLSFELRVASDVPSFEGALGDDLRVLQAVRHQAKLRIGHVRANRFEIVIRQVPVGGVARAERTLEALRATGVPNTFGPQRFGRDGDNVETALAFIRGQTRPPRDRKLRDLLVSAAQSEVFNRVLERRLALGLFARALEGDVMQKHDSGGLFDVTDPAAEQPRVDRVEISPTAPLPGKRTRAASGQPRAIEEAVLAEVGISEAELGAFADGTRRTMRYPLDPEARIVPLGEDSYRLEVTLPSGAYATVLLDELVKPEGRPFDRS